MRTHAGPAGDRDPALCPVRLWGHGVPGAPAVPDVRCHGLGQRRERRPIARGASCIAVV